MVPDSRHASWRPLPLGFKEERGAEGASWIVREGLPTRLSERQWNRWVRGDGGEPLQEPGGRAPVLRISLSEHNHAILRHYRHGGFWGILFKDFFWGNRRFLSELRVSDVVRSKGVATPEILAIYSRPKAGPWVHGWLLTRYISGGSNLRRWVAERFGDKDAREAVLRITAETVASLHQAGCFHRDLNLSNLLLTHEGIHILDLDGGTIALPLRLQQRSANLLRLYRSLTKETGNQEPLSLRERLRFLKAYSRGEPELFTALWRHLDRRWTISRLRRRVSQALKW